MMILFTYMIDNTACVGEMAGRGDCLFRHFGKFSSQAQCVNPVFRYLSFRTKYREVNQVKYSTIWCFHAGRSIT